MWVLFWIFISSTGGLTSGSQEFPSAEACSAAKGEINKLAIGQVDKATKAGFSSISFPIELVCINKQTGKP